MTRATRIMLMLLLVGVLTLAAGIGPPLQAQQPVLQVSPTSLSFQGQAGGSVPDPQYLSIANAGGGIMEWHASRDADWIILGASDGKLSGGREVQRTSMN